MSKRTCIVPECNSPYVARGYCNKHYKQFRRVLTPCAYDGCPNGRAYRDGYCPTHHQRFMIHGDPSITMKGKAHKVRYTPDGLRICKKCGQPKPDTQFHKSATGSNGLRADCKTCAAQRGQARYEANSEAIREYMRNHRMKNIDAIREADKQRYERDRDKRIEASAAAYHKRRATIRTTAVEDGVTIKALRLRDGDNCCYCQQPMIFKSRPRAEGIHPLRATLEHLQPISRGGEHTMANTALACHACNTSKNAKTVQEWEAWKERAAKLSASVA